MCIKIFLVQTENLYYGYNTSVNISDVQMDASTEGLVDCTWSHGGVQMDACANGLVVACEHAS